MTLNNSNRSTSKRKKKARQKESSHKKKIALSTKISVSLLCLMFIGVGVGASYAKKQYQKVVNQAVETGYQLAEEMKESDFVALTPTRVLDQQDQLIQEFRSKKYEYLPIDKMDHHVYEALISIEDKRFYQHQGVDIKGLAGVAVNAALGKGMRGASTITQQLVKNIYLSDEVTVSRKLTEMVIAQKLEDRYPKKKILEYYLNNVYYGYNCYGINTASLYYFNQSVNDITLLQQATLVGVTNNPTQYDPIKEPKAAEARGKLILSLMAEQGYLSESELQKSLKETLKTQVNTNVLDNQVKDNQVAVAMDFATKKVMADNGFRFQYEFNTGEEQQEYFARYNERYNETYNKVVSGGYQIKTSINQDLQRKLQQQVTDIMSPYTEIDPDTQFYTKQAAMTVIDNQTGMIVASIGGRGEANNTYNRASLSLRQPGSAIKPFLSYAYAYEQGLLETSQVSDDRLNANYPNNVYLKSMGNLTLRRALAISSNVVAYKLLLNVENPLEKLAAMEFSGLDYRDKNPIIAIGGFTMGITNQDLAGAMATVVNNGNYREPTNVVSLVENETGRVIYNHEKAQEKKIYSDDVSYLLLDTMKGVVTEPGGTGESYRLPNYPHLAVKTGTTDQAKDKWSVGATPYYSVAVWTGYDTPTPMGLEDIDSAAIFKQAMATLIEGKPVIDFNRPSSVYKVNDQWVTLTSQREDVLKNRRFEDIKQKSQDKKQLEDYRLAAVNQLPQVNLTKPEDYRYLQQLIANLANYPLKVSVNASNFSVIDQMYRSLTQFIGLLYDSQAQQDLTNQLEQAYANKQSELTQLQNQVTAEHERELAQYDLAQLKEKEKEKEKDKKEKEKESDSEKNSSDKPKDQEDKPSRHD